MYLVSVSGCLIWFRGSRLQQFSEPDVFLAVDIAGRH